MLENITLDQSEVTAEIDAYIHHVVLQKEGVFNYGQALKCEVVNNNLLKLYDGLFVNQGRFFRIVPGSYEEIKIANGVVGQTRYDLIVSHFETDGVNETHEIKVIQGDVNGNKPTATTSDTFSGGTINEVPLFLVKLNGINIEEVTKQFEYMPTLNKTLQYASEGDGYIEVEILD